MMKVCLRCGYAYTDQATECPDCGGGLTDMGEVSEEQARAAVDEMSGWQAHTAARRQFVDLEVVHRVLSEYEGELLRDLLEQNDIPAMLRSLQIPWYDGIAAVGMTGGVWGEVIVRATDAAAARRLIADFEVPPDSSLLDSDAEE